MQGTAFVTQLMQDGFHSFRLQILDVPHQGRQSNSALLAHAPQVAAFPTQSFL